MIPFSSSPRANCRRVPRAEGSPPWDRDSAPSRGTATELAEITADVVDRRPGLVVRGVRPLPFELPPFVPTRWLPGAHAQTLGGVFWPYRRIPRPPRHHVVRLDDGDAVVLHDDLPAGWRRGDPTCLLLHGVGGDHRSPYMVRLSDRLTRAGIRAFRLDMRGCGAAAGLAQRPFHAGRSGDVAAAAVFLADLCPGSRLSLLGFSLGGNMVLKFLGETDRPETRLVASAAAVNPCVDLIRCRDSLERPLQRIYNLYMTKLLVRQMQRNQPAMRSVAPLERVRRLVDLDEQFTAPVSGFASATDYYLQASGGPYIERIETPTLIFAAVDDPIVPIAPFVNLPLGDFASLVITESGGHLGYVARRGIDPDRRWLDWRILDWLRHGGV